MGKNQKNSNKSAKADWDWRRYASPEFFKNLLWETDYCLPVAVLLVIVEVLASVFVVRTVNYTEIDWKAYMEEVEGFMNGTLDYSLLKGGTGPLVYPAGFVYLYSALYFLTSSGSDIRTAQYIFVGVYVLTLTLVFRLYVRSKKVPPYILVLMSCTSYRIHSIYMLRLFNDPFAVLFLYAALNLFLDGRWTLGSVLFSLAVSVKMNILLYSPALLIAYLTCLSVKQTLFQLSVCGAIQLLVGLPFLLESPLAYLKGSFDLGRIFLHEWTVNWRFLPEHIFTNRFFHLGLLGIHILLLLVFYNSFVTYLRSYARLKALEERVRDQVKEHNKSINMGTTSQLFLLPFFLANFIGVACSRSLHYQFYVWYYHTLPYLLWCTRLSVKWRLTVLGLIEMSWNTFPSTDFSSAILHVCHMIILASLYTTLSSNVKAR